MTFEQRLAAHAAATDRYLDRELATADGVPARLRDAMRLALMGGGKRFRPFLVIESARLFDIDTGAALPTAAALECLHCYSLVHDDLPAMDNDRLRRGQPTVWAQFDDWTAILAGDALLTLSFEILSRPETLTDPGGRTELVASLAKAGGAAGMVGGQVHDLMADKLGEPPRPTLEHIRRLQAMKTGALIQFACEAGAILGGARPDLRRALASFGAHLGVVFQIADDLLDVSGDSETVGKATGKDAAAGKATQVSLLGLDAARAYLAETASAALGDLAPFGDRAEVLAEAVTFAAERVK
ncbi:MAG: polyprenyl synthetase family protein [Alphaproteobacteria bacterium]|nr:polyprenyl synthetase family protein [Alphaproteobacteria bacterium]